MSATRHILIVEDEPNVRLTFRASLRSPDLTVVCAEDGEAALRWLDHERIDLVLLDLRLPGIPGMDVLRRMRAAGHDVPVVVVTAHGTIPNAVEAMREGAVDFIAKPLTPAALRQAVAAVLARHDQVTGESGSLVAGPRTHDTLSVAKRALNHRLFGRAERLLREVVKERAAKAEAWYLLGVLREVQQKPRAAIEAYQNALRSDPNYESAKLHLMKFESVSGAR